MIPKKPENVFWSAEQWAAIYEKGQDILINAGAGSGKTAVLTERIIRILKDGVKLERLIVLTFTRAAAGEMKERLRKKLQKEIASGFNLKEALEYLDQASVQTFDSFALELVRKYHYLLGVDRTITIGDGVLFSLKKKEIIAQVFDSFYEEEDQAFLDFVTLFALKNDKTLQKYIFAVDNKLELIYDRKAYLDSYLEKYYCESFIKTMLRRYVNLLLLEQGRIRSRLERLREEITDEDLMLHVVDCEHTLAALLKSKSYLEFKVHADVTLPRLPRHGDESEKAIISYEKNQIKDSIKRLQTYLDYENEEEMYQTLIATKTQIATLIRILERVNEEFLKYKREYNIYEFHDIAKMAIKLLKENGEIRDYIKEHTYEILIDEYQDTNDLQEILISLISKNNVYMVGDVKQSIYRFRNANPEIFKKKYADFQKEKTGLAIDLSRNFRSRREVLEDINFIFEQVMDSRLGGVNYTEGQELSFGNKKYEKNAPEKDYRLRLLTYDYTNEALKPAEIEAFIIGNDIKRLIAEGLQIYDKDEDAIKPARYSHFTILTSEKRHFDLYKKIFEYLEIPLVIHKDESFIRSQEIYVLINILRAVHALLDAEYFRENFKDALLSILRSFLVEGDDREIFKVYQGDLLEGLNCRFPEVYQNLIKISELAEKATLSQILWEIYENFGFYFKIIKIGNLEDGEEKLNFLLNKFQELDKLGFSLPDAILYLEEIMAGDLDLEFSRPVSLDTDAVQMMSIHKSKGLEFPICYFSDLETKFKFTELNDRIVFDQEYGFIIPYFKEGLTDLFTKKLLKQKYQIEEISERIRVLYVALTRAKEQIILVAPEFMESYRTERKLLPYVDRLNYKSAYSIFSSIANTLSERIQLVSTLSYTKDYEQGKILSIKAFPKLPPLEVKRVTLKKEKSEKIIASTQATTLFNPKTIEAINLGNLLHEILEIIDFKDNPETFIKRAPVPDTLKKRLLTLFQNSLFKKPIIQTYHEYPFYHKETETSGVIDLILETETELVILDYKLSDLSKIEYERQLAVYKAYLESISEKRVSAYLYSILRKELKQVY